MSSDEVDADPHDGRDATQNERMDRNWIEVLQELRVLQTGTQILTGFLLALAFQPAFADLTAAQRTFYLVLVVLAAADRDASGLRTPQGWRPVSLGSAARLETVWEELGRRHTQSSRSRGVPTTTPAGVPSGEGVA